MIVYVAHKYGGSEKNLERAKKITHDLQVKDPANCYISPSVAFSTIGYGELGYKAEMEICIDLLSVCDKLVVASEISEGVGIEIDFARLVGMEVEFLENAKGN
jgi:hypothetical protein